MTKPLDLKRILEIAEKKRGTVPDQKIFEFLRHQAFLHYDHKSDAQIVKFDVAINEAVTIIEGRKEGNILKGLSTGFSELDSAIGFLQRDTIYFIGARPGVGKTAVEIILTDNIFNYNYHPDIAIGVLQWNFEAANYQTALRYISKHTKETYSKLMSKKKPLTDNLFNEVLKAKIKLSDREIYMISSPTKPELMAAKAIDFANKFKEQNKGKEVFLFNVIDHTLLSLKEKAQSNTDLVDSTSKACIFIKKETGMSSIILSQLKDECVKIERAKEQYLPRASDLAWSQTLEQDAEVIILLHSPFQLKQSSFKVGTMDYPATFTDDKGRKNVNLLVMSIPKNRYGSPTTLFYKDLIRINDIEEIEDPDNYFKTLNRGFSPPKV